MLSAAPLVWVMVGVGADTVCLMGMINDRKEFQ